MKMSEILSDFFLTFYFLFIYFIFFNFYLFIFFFFFFFFLVVQFSLYLNRHVFVMCPNIMVNAV